MKNRETAQFGEERHDREIVSAVRRKLEHSRYKSLRRIRCKVVNGSVILSGTVSTEDDRELAIEVARSCPLVDSVVDEIAVEADSAGSDANTASAL